MGCLMMDDEDMPEAPIDDDEHEYDDPTKRID